MKRSFGPIADARTRVLLLGSLPGDASLALGRYYGHPRNQFWRLIEATFGVVLPEPYDARLQALRGLGIGLWDVVGSADRDGSLDAAIRRHEPNALDAFVSGLPSLMAIGFNGSKAAQIGRRILRPTPGVTLVDLPSSSPAHTAPFDVKAAAWKPLAAFLDG